MDIQVLGVRVLKIRNVWNWLEQQRKAISDMQKADIRAQEPANSQMYIGPKLR